MPILLPVLALVVTAVAPPPAEAQGTDPARVARSAAYRYESLLRLRAPDRFGGYSGPCRGEIIGRFCFWFTDDDGPEDTEPAPEHPDVSEARRQAVRAYRRWLSVDPADPNAAGGLVRYLIEDGRPAEAVPVARTHAWADGDAGSLLLLGLTLHHTGDFAASEAAIDSARTLAGPSTRAEWDDVGVLLEPAERARYDDLTLEQRRAYNRRFWAFSDPSMLAPGNERRSAHYARHAWIAILAEAPRAAGMLSRGPDHEEILRRYGLPWSRERIRRPIPSQLGRDVSMVTVFDPRAVSFVPSRLLTGSLPEAPVPGLRPHVERDSVRTSYAPIWRDRRVRMRGLTGQVTRLPAAGGGWTLRVDAVLLPDTAESEGPAVPVAPRGLLAVFDTMGRELARSEAAVGVRADSATVVRAEVPVGAGRHVYQAELRDDSTGLAGWVRHRIDVAGRAVDLPSLSDPLIAVAPDTGELPVDRRELTPFPTLVLPTGGAVLVYAEARGLRRVAGTARYSVEWWLEEAGSGSVVGRALQWVGRTLGLLDDGEAVRLRWQDAWSEADPVPVSFVVDLGTAEAGLYRLGLRVRDEISGRAVMSYRVVRLEPRGPASVARTPY